MTIIRRNPNNKDNPWAILVRLDGESVIVSECSTLAEAIRVSAEFGCTSHFATR